METPLQNLIITGTTGMVGQSVLIESLADPAVGKILSLSRRPTGLPVHPKLKEVLVKDFYDLSPIASELAGYDGCMHCLGASSVGMNEADYTRVTYDLALELARTVLATNPNIGLTYVSGGGTNTNGSQMWARVKGRTEDALLAMPFRHVHMIRLGFLEASKGVKPANAWYGILYVILRPFFFLFKLTGMATNGHNLQRAMRRAAVEGYAKPVLEVKDINALGQQD